MLVPIIQYSSMFVKTSNLTQFYSNQEMHSEAALFSQLDLDLEPPTFYDLFNFYNLFNHGITVQDITEIYQPQDKNIDIKYKI